MSTPRWVAAHILQAVVLDVTLATKDVIDVRGFTHLFVYPDSGGKVKYSVVLDEGETVHGPSPVTGSTDEIQEIEVAGNYYMVEAITADCHAHPVFLNVSGGGGSDLEVDDEGTPLTTAATKIDFAGAGVTATEPVTDEILVTIPGKTLSVEDEGIEVVANATILDFKGAGVVAADDGSGQAGITIAGGGGVSVEDEGVELTASVAVMDFVGSGVTVTEPTADNVEITIPGTTGLIGPIKDLQIDRRSSGNFTLNSTTWVNLDTGLDLVLNAVVGDFIAVGMSALHDNEAVNTYLDVVSLVSGSPVNSWSRDAAPAAAHNGLMAWRGQASEQHTAGGSIIRAVVSGDLSAGTVTLRFRYKTNIASNKTLWANTDNTLQVWAINYGQTFATPSAVPSANLVVDLNADSITGETHDTALSTWPNDGSLADFTSATTDRPNYRTDGPNGRAMVRFNDAGSDEFMDIASGVTAFTEGCVIAALKRTVNSAVNAAYYCHQSTLARVDSYIVRRDSSQDVIGAWNGSSWFEYFGRLARIDEWIVIGSNLQADGILGMWSWDGSGASSQRWFETPDYGTYPSFNGLRIGSSTSAGSHYQGDIFRLLEYDAPLSQADFYQAMRRLAYEVGLPVGAG